MEANIVLAPCQHADDSWGADRCSICHGSGYVKVIAGPDGQPVPCKHGGTSGWGASRCSACKGSGWAGVILD